MDSNAGYEVITGAPQLGSIEHIKQAAETLESLSLRSPDELLHYLAIYSVPESLAYFIFQNQTPKRWESGKTVTMDTREVYNYNPSAVQIDGRYHYDPYQDNNSVFLYVRPLPKDEPVYNQAYQVRFSLKNNLYPSLPVEALAYRGDIGGEGVIDPRIFRSQASSSYGENEVAVFVDVMQKVAQGLEQFTHSRSQV